MSIDKDWIVRRAVGKVVAPYLQKPLLLAGSLDLHTRDGMQNVLKTYNSENENFQQLWQMGYLVRKQLFELRKGNV